MKEFAFKLNGAEYKCAVEQIEAGKAKVTVNGKVYEVAGLEPEQASHAARPVAAKPAAAPAPKPAPAADLQQAQQRVSELLLSEQQELQQEQVLEQEQQPV